MIKIRPLTEADLEQHLQLCYTLDQESEFMLLEPDERTTSVEQHRFINQPLLDAEHSTILVAEDEGRLVGHLVARGSELAQIRHSAYLVIGVLREYSSQGLGRGTPFAFVDNTWMNIIWLVFLWSRRSCYEVCSRAV
ncbi:GNAT family N-acetyltransferase [Paenibacillus massiliensis]|uniref:GNAT family N-acetyltransferase n=1 Tax=Paenibacillus massiliensis TaxID=225917 RepID=UPI0004016A0A|nr:GNAT family N-acetyltransferase [Paenibacillus massiliensis]